MPCNKKPIYKLLSREQERKEIKCCADVTNVNSNLNRRVKESRTTQTDVIARRK